MFPASRPTVDETEEDLLRFQEEFLRSRATPAAKLIKKPDKRPAGSPISEVTSAGPSTKQTPRDVVSLGGLPSKLQDTSSAPPTKRSKFKERHGKKAAAACHTGFDAESELEVHDSHITKVLTEIVERDVAHQPVYYPSTLAPQGFPVAPHRGSQQGSGDGKKKSIFAQQFAIGRAKGFGLNMKSPPNQADMTVQEHSKLGTSVNQGGEKSHVVSGQGLKPGKAEDEAKKLHDENKAKMAAMSEAEKVEEQRHLLETLDPSLIAFLRSRKAKEGQQVGHKDQASRSDQEMQIDETLPSTSTVGLSQVVQSSNQSDTTLNLGPVSRPAMQIDSSRDLSSTLPDTAIQGMNTNHKTGQGMDTNHATCTTSKEEQQASWQEKDEQKGDVDLPIHPAKDWVNMDTVEADKLSWTKDLPPPPSAQNTSTGQQARFDLQGTLLAFNADLPTHLGLHHHGDEPERAGYTLEELFQLARSANMQQRVLALTTVSRIIRNARRGDLHEVVHKPIIPALLQGGIVFLIRWALDDSTDNTMAAAISCLHSLIVCEQDEEASDKTAVWHQGLSLPSLEPEEEKEEENDVDEEEKPQETDADVIKKDVIKGLLRMQLLPRLRYILEVWRAPAPVTIEVLEILTRIARHSTQAAYEIVQCPRLIQTIFSEFLPTTWTPTESDTVLPSVYGYPVPAALKLIRVICLAGSNMAANMISNFWLMSSVSRYLVEDPSDLNLPLPMATQLQLESLHAWRVCTTYGLASHSFSDLYPVLMECMKILPSLYHMSNPSLIQWGSALVCLLEAIVSLGASTRHAAAPSQSHHMEGMERVSGGVAPAPPAINWSHVSGLMQPLQLCLENALKDFTEFYPSKKHDVTFASCCLNFMATFITKMDSQPGYDAIEALENLERLTEKILEPCLQSQAFKRVLHAARDHSVVVHVAEAKRGEVTKNLPEMGALLNDSGAICPLLKTTSTIHLVLAMARILHAIGRLHKGLTTKIYKYMLADSDLVLYLRKSCQAKHTNVATNTFVRFENMLHYYLLSMARFQPDLCDTQLMHQVALFLITRLHHGDEHIAHELLSTIIFNADFVGDLVTVEMSALSDLDQLQLDDHQTAPLSSATQQTVQTTRVDLAKDILEHLAGMRGTFLTVATGLVQQLQQSRSRLLSIPQQITRLMTGRHKQVFVPVDWPFLPLVNLYNKSSQPLGGGEQTTSPQLVSMVTETLRCVYVLERWRPGLLDSVTFVTKLSRLMCTFLAGSDLFLDPTVHVYLEAIYRLYCRPVFLKRMDFTKPVPGLPSFYDLFVLFLTQYEAVSFGDSLFGSFLLLPIQQRHNVQLRSAIWCEHTTVLRALVIPLKEVPIPLENFLSPEETDLGLLRLYFEALYSGSVSSRWSPLLYLVAVHHVNRFLYTQHGEAGSLRHAMLQQLHHFKNKDVRRHLLLYKTNNVDAALGMDLYTELPSNRQKVVTEAKLNIYF